MACTHGQVHFIVNSVLTQFWNALTFKNLSFRKMSCGWKKGLFFVILKTVQETFLKPDSLGVV